MTDFEMKDQESRTRKPKTEPVSQETIQITRKQTTETKQYKFPKD